MMGEHAVAIDHYFYPDYCWRVPTASMHHFRNHGPDDISQSIAQQCNIYSLVHMTFAAT